MDSPPSTAAGGLPRSELYEDEEDSSTLMLPRSQLESLSELEVTQVQTDLSTELYGFSPITFTSRVVDVANEVIYDVIDKIEIECMSRWVDGVSDADETRKQAVQKVSEGRARDFTRSKNGSCRGLMLRFIYNPTGRQPTRNTPHGRRRPTLRPS